MTTIAYRAGIMAADSKCSDDGRFATKMHKISRLSSGALLGSAGDVDCRDVRKFLDKVKSERSMPSRADLSALKLDYRGLLVLPNQSIWFVDIDREDDGPDIEYLGSIMQCLEPFAAVGSGADFATGAMTFGAGAEQAVHVACRYDLYSGTPVRTVPLRRSAKTEP